MKKWVDHKGNKFDSMRLMAEYWGLTKDTLRDRLANNKSIEESLETPVKRMITPVECYNMKFDSISSFARYLKVEKTVIINRTDKKETYEQIHDKLICDIEEDGLLFSRVSDLVEYLELNMTSVLYGLDKGMSIKEAIVREKEIIKTIELTGLSRGTIQNEINRGESYESICKIHCIDYIYDNKMFKNLKALAKYLKLNPSSLTRVVKGGGNLDEYIYLNTPIIHKGVSYKNHKKLVDKLGDIGYIQYVYWIRKGYSCEEALKRKLVKNENKERYVLGVKVRDALRVLDKSFKYFEEFKDYENYIFKLLWQNYNFLGFTEDNRVVYRKSDNNEISCTSFKEYISYLKSV